MPYLHCWQADLTRPIAEAPLSAAERARQARLRTPALRQTYGRAHGFVRQVLAGYAGQPAAALAFAADARGKPHLPGGPHFSLSYRPGRALLAVADAGPVGADVEELQALPETGALLREAFAPDEQAALAAAGAEHYWPLFYRLWTRKEAYVKALGLGLAAPLAGFSVLHAAPPGATLHSFGLPGGYCGAVAALGGAAGLAVEQFVFDA